MDPVKSATLDRTLPLPALAKAWGWSQGKLYRLVEAGAIPHLRIRGRIYFEESSVESWKAAHRRAGAARGSDPADGVGWSPTEQAAMERFL